MELFLLPQPAVQHELHHVAGHRHVRPSALGLSRHRPGGLPHSGAPRRENSEDFDSKIDQHEVEFSSIFIETLKHVRRKSLLLVVFVLNICMVG